MDRFVGITIVKNTNNPTTLIYIMPGFINRPQHRLLFKHLPTASVNEGGEKPAHVIPGKYDGKPAAAISAVYFQHLRPTAIVCGYRFGVIMKPEVCPELRCIANLRDPCQTHP
jgi:hypothetical protein